MENEVTRVDKNWEKIAKNISSYYNLLIAEVLW